MRRHLPRTNTGRMTTTQLKPPAKPELTRPRHGRIIAGVCAGIADRYGWSRTTVRIVAVLSCLLPGPQFLAYLALWALMPSQDD
jgi:phage shock protein PspC (stress-responsive transcriptional regulator)